MLKQVPRDFVRRFMKSSLISFTNIEQNEGFRSGKGHCPVSYSDRFRMTSLLICRWIGRI